MASLASASIQTTNSGKAASLRPLAGVPAQQNASNTSAHRDRQSGSPSHMEGRSEYGSTAVGDSAPVVSSFDDPDDVGSTPQLGYKDELEVRFIWDRVVEKNSKENYLDRVVIDRYANCYTALYCKYAVGVIHSTISYIL
jgi:hypothetical protein